MEDIRHDSINAFNTCFTNNHICMLKILLPLCDFSIQRHIAIYIRYLELQYTMEYFKQPFYYSTHTPPNNFSFNDSCSYNDMFFKKQPFDFNDICDQLLPFCNSKEKQQFTQIRNLVQNFQYFKNMVEMIDTIKTLFPEGIYNSNNESSDDGMDFMTIISNMFGNTNIAFNQMTDLFSTIDNMDISAMSDLFSGNT